MIEKGTFVRIRKTLLDPKDRSTNLPKDTQQVPFKLWVKGTLLDDAEMFDYVNIQTVTGRIVNGKLKESNPKYKHGYGDFVPEILTIRKIIKEDTKGNQS
ncbi:MAG: 2-amino-4-ketopentanoate thiolase [Candidatus Izimaplasma sp.]|nr:2-amino-4-ketopentanoate thiolase [Candidatus Izimaplasma bacterium]